MNVDTWIFFNCPSSGLSSLNKIPICNPRRLSQQLLCCPKALQCCLRPCGQTIIGVEEIPKDAETRTHCSLSSLGGSLSERNMVPLSDFDP